MSAYLMSENGIAYLVEAGAAWRVDVGRILPPMTRKPGDTAKCPVDPWLSFRHTREALGQMLWDENQASLNERYSETDDGLIYAELPRKFWHSFDRVQVIKCAHCYEYQSCEHDGWEDSRAARYMEELIATAIRNLPGYDDAKWGAPESRQDGKIISMMDMAHGDAPGR